MTDDLFFLMAVARKVLGSKFDPAPMQDSLFVDPSYGPNGDGRVNDKISMDLSAKHTRPEYWRSLWDHHNLVDQFMRGTKGCLEAKITSASRNVQDVFEALSDHCSMVLENSGKIIFQHHLCFPPLLKTIKNCPKFITCLGDPERLRDPLVSLVGSRKANRKALHESYRTGYELAQRGITIVSGGAFGCDIASHEGTLDWEQRPCRAIVVFAGGLGFLYPAAHRSLFKQIVSRGGCLVSERLWNTKPFRSDFPIRNRLIAGMAGLLLLMQAGDPSGAMITARLGIDYGSDLAVLAHHPEDVRALGGQSLIEQGAFSFDRVEDLLPILQGQRMGEA